MNALQKFEEKNLAVFQQLADIAKAKKRLDAEEKDLKEALLIQMENHGVTSIDNDIIRISYIAESESVSLDVKGLLAEDPDTYHELEQKYNKRTKKKAYIRFTAK